MVENKKLTEASRPAPKVTVRRPEVPPNAPDKKQKKTAPAKKVKMCEIGETPMHPADQIEYAKLHREQQNVEREKARERELKKMGLDRKPSGAPQPGQRDRDADAKKVGRPGQPEPAKKEQKRHSPTSSKSRACRPDSQSEGEPDGADMRIAPNAEKGAGGTAAGLAANLYDTEPNARGLELAGSPSNTPAAGARAAAGGGAGAAGPSGQLLAKPETETREKRVVPVGDKLAVVTSPALGEIVLSDPDLMPPQEHH